MSRGLEALLVLWVATLPTDRVDLLGGMVGFVLTPYLALTPLVVLLLGYRRLAHRESFDLPENFRPFALALVALVSVIVLSALLAMDPVISLWRVLHFLAVSVGGSLVALLLIAEGKAGRVLARGGELGLALMLVFAVLGVWVLLSQTGPVLRLGPATLSLEPSTYGGIVPRFTGSVADANRAGFATLFFLSSMAQFGRPGVRRQLWLGAGVLMAILTLSRSTLLAGGVLLVTAWLLRTSFRVSRSHVAAASLALVMGAGLLLAFPSARETMAGGLEPFGSRFSLQEESTKDHFRLMARGVEEETASLKRAAIGIGYGNAHLVLEDMFSGSKYGNFHSAYVTLLAECGVFSFLLFVLILGYPLARPGPLTPFVAALAAFNIFYQTFNGPILWLVLALAWMAGETTLTGPRDPGEDPRPAPLP